MPSEYSRKEAAEAKWHFPDRLDLSAPGNVLGHADDSPRQLFFVALDSVSKVPRRGLSVAPCAQVSHEDNICRAGCRNHSGGRFRGRRVVDRQDNDGNSFLPGDCRNGCLRRPRRIQFKFLTFKHIDDERLFSLTCYIPRIRCKAVGKSGDKGVESAFLPHEVFLKKYSAGGLVSPLLRSLSRQLCGFFPHVGIGLTVIVGSDIKSSTPAKRHDDGRQTGQRLRLERGSAVGDVFGCEGACDDNFGDRRTLGCPKLDKLGCRCFKICNGKEARVFLSGNSCGCHRQDEGEGFIDKARGMLFLYGFCLSPA